MINSRRISTFDGLRGWAALTVAVYHGISRPTKNAHEALLTPIQNISDVTSFLLKFLMMTFNGSLAVVIFFVLSGRVLFDSLLRNSSTALPTSFEFAVKRLIRIYPVLWLALAAYVLMLLTMDAVFGSQLTPAIKPVLENATLMKRTMYGAAWTLTVEVLAVPVILASFFAYKKWGTTALVAILSILIMTKGMGLFPTLYVADYGFLFALGFISSVLALKNWKQPEISELWLLIILIYGTSFVQYNLPGVVVFQGIISFLLISKLSENEYTPVKSLLSTPLSQFLGSISFSFYILHPLPLTFLDYFGREFFLFYYTNNFLISGIIVGVFTTIFTLPLAALAYNLIEVPTINLGKSLFRKKVVDVAAV